MRKQVFFMKKIDFLVRQGFSYQASQVTKTERTVRFWRQRTRPPNDVLPAGGIGALQVWQKHCMTDSLTNPSSIFKLDWLNLKTEETTDLFGGRCAEADWQIYSGVATTRPGGKRAHPLNKGVVWSRRRRLPTRWRHCHDRRHFLKKKKHVRVAKKVFLRVPSSLDIQGTTNQFWN